MESFNCRILVSRITFGTPVIPAMFYLSVRLAGYLIDSENNRGARKLTWTSELSKRKKKKKNSLVNQLGCLWI
jgi:hypothetical protein